MTTTNPPEYIQHDFTVLNAHVQNELERTRQFQRYDASLVWWMRAKAFGITLLAIGVLAVLLSFAWKFYRDAMVERDIKAESGVRIAAVEERSRKDISTLNIEIAELQQEVAAQRNSGLDAARNRAEDVKQNITGTGPSRFEIVQFIEIEFERDGIKKVVTGKEYANEDTYTPTKQWCYVEKLMPTDESLRRVQLAGKYGADIQEGNVTLKAAKTLDVSITTLRSARKLCRFS